MLFKICTRCGIEKTNESFSSRRQGGVHGTRSECRECAKKIKRENDRLKTLHFDKNQICAIRELNNTPETEFFPKDRVRIYYPIKPTVRNTASKKYIEHSNDVNEILGGKGIVVRKCHVTGNYLVCLEDGFGVYVNKTNLRKLTT